MSCVTIAASVLALSLALALTHAPSAHAARKGGDKARPAASKAAPLADASSPDSSDTPGGAFELLQKKAQAFERKSNYEGWGYLISGVVALGVSVPAYYVSDDVFAKAVYSVTETLSVAAIGYGSYQLLVDDDMTRYIRIVRSVPGLSSAQRDQFAMSYLRESADRARNVRRIRVISHGLTAALNFVNAFTSSNDNLSQALYFVGGVNTLAAVSFAIGKSDEEKALEAQDAASGSRRTAGRFEVFVGPVTGLAYRF
jgi:hypothetical protein